MYKFFLDADMLLKWGALLQYFVDTEIAYEAAKDYEQYPGTSSTMFTTVYWTDLQNGVDLTDKYGGNSAPFIVPFTMRSWLKSEHYVGTYSHGADYSTEEVQKNALSYFIPSTETTILVPVGETITLPSLAKVGNTELNFRGWEDGEGNVNTSGILKPEGDVYLSGAFGAQVQLNAADDAKDSILFPLTNEGLVVVKEGEAAYTLPTLERNHYDFLGWYDAKGNKYTEITENDSVKSLTAHWMGNIYTISYVGQENDLETSIIVYGNKLGTLPEGEMEGMVFKGWWTKDGSTTGDWGEEITSSTVVSGVIIAYAKFIKPYDVYFNYDGSLRPIETGAEAKDEFLADFYAWCVKQGAFKAEDVSFETFKGESYNGTWINYVNGAGNPSSLFPAYDAEMKANYFYAPSGDAGTGRTNAVIENTQYFINDAEMNAKWAPYMEYIKVVCNNASRFWGDEATNYFIYELGRFMAADYDTFKGSYNATNADKRETLKPANCEHLFAVGGEKENLRTFVLGASVEFPVATKEGHIFTGWTDGEKVYTAFTAEELNGKTLTPAFVKQNVVEVTPETFAAKLAEAKEGDVFKLAAGEYAGFEITVPYVTIAGPNAGVAGTAERADEAVITSPIKLAAKGATLDGVKLATTVKVEIACDNATLNNVYSVAATFGSVTGVNRTAVLFTNTKVANVTVANSYFNIGASVYCKGVWSSNETVTNAKFVNNYFTNEATSCSISDCIAMYSAAGKIEFIGNQFIWVTDDWDIMLGNYGNSCYEINVIDNVFDGQNGLYSCGITLRNLPAGAVMNIVHNTFGDLDGTVFGGNSSAAGSETNIKFNSFGAVNYKATHGSGTYNYEGNYYEESQTTATADYGVITSIEALEAAYAAFKK